MSKKVIEDPKVHVLDEEAYAETQTNDKIKDGDVLVVPSVGVIGVLVSAWPVAVVFENEDYQRIGFHILAADADIACLGARPEHRSMVWIHPVDAPKYEHEEVWPEDPGTDYTASWNLANEVAKKS